MGKKLLFCLLIFCAIFKSAAQDKEFWFVAPDVAEDHSDNPVFFVFTNPGTEIANVKVDIYAGSAPGTVGRTELFTINPGSFKKLDFTNLTEIRTQIENPTIYAGNINNYSIHITSDIKILAYYMVNGVGQRDIFTLKGKSALGTYFITPFEEHQGNYFEQRTSFWYNKGADQINIVATENGTTVYATLTKNCIKYDGTIIPAGIRHSFGPMVKGQTLTLREDTAKYGTSDAQIAQAKNDGTLAGSVIESSKPIAITISEDCLSAVMTYNNGGTDLAGDQIVPVNMVGKRYVVIRGRSTVGERVDFTATANNTVINVYYFDGITDQVVSSPVLNANDTWHVDMNRLPNELPGDKSSDIFVDATQPVYCYQHSAVNGELGAAIIPSMYSISQQQIDYYQSPGDIGNYLFLVFRKDCDTTFTIAMNGGTEFPLYTVVPGFLSSVKDIPSTIADEWRYARIQIPGSYDNSMVTLRNYASPFSVGYFNGTSNAASYGYLSGFGDFEFDPDTIWRCADNAQPVTLTAGYAKDYEWILPDGSVKTTPSIKAYQAGKYILNMDQDPRIVTDSIWIIDMRFNAEITREPNKPAKVGASQIFSATLGGGVLPSLNYYWTFEGGTPATSTLQRPTVTWNSTGQKTVTLKLTAKGGVGANEVACDTTITMDLLIRPKHNGYFVDQNVGGGNHDGSNWQNAFVTIQEALELASQGDYIWVAKGEYSPFADDTYLIDYDSVSIYGGFGAWEANLNERDFAANSTILNGKNNSVVTFDGGTSYSNGLCGIGTGAVLDGFIIQNGKAANGAGILFRNGASGTISNCIIRGNHATQNGGGLHLVTPGCGHDSPIFFNLEVSGNTAARGAGIYNSGSDFTATNITVSGNKATGTGGLYNTGGNPNMHNTIIWGNRDNSMTLGAMDVTVSAGTPVYTYSIIGGSNGSGSAWNVVLGTDAGKNLDVSPLFRKSGFDNSGNMRQGNYQLTATSKAVNTGRNNFVLQGNHLLGSINLLTPTDTVFISYIPNDLNGANRIEYDIVDRGAYEYYKNYDNAETVHQIFIPVIDNMTTDPETGLYWVRGHDSFVLILYPKDGYSLKNITITTGSKWQDEDGAMLVVHNEDGSVTVTFREVFEPINVQISGVDPVSNEMIDSSYAIWTGNKRLHIRTTKTGILKVYTLVGAILKQQELSEGEISFPLSQGVYIVTFNDEYQQKIVVK